ncbi:MAG: Minf_1886 family protein [Candidatus Brocadiia bacterium]|jgi:uncharacterized repeat protein (TIGR04138 family)
MTEEKAPQSPAAKPEAVPAETAIRQQILSRDSRYELAAYLFIYDALTYTQKALGRNAPDLTPAQRHVSGQELLNGIREYAAQMFGPLAPTVFRTWRVRRTEDFGEIVFNLVEHGLLGKTESDAREDFAGGFDFDTAFEGPFKAEPQ